MTSTQKPHPVDVALSEMAYPNDRDCEHGRQRRACEVCERDERIAALEAENARLREAIQLAIQHPWGRDMEYTDEDMAILERLRAALAVKE